MKWWWPRWLAEHAGRAIDDRARAVAEAAVAREERALALAGEKAEVLALGLVGDREPGRGGELAHLGLGQLGEREAQAARSESRARSPESM